MKRFHAIEYSITPVSIVINLIAGDELCTDLLLVTVSIVLPIVNGYLKAASQSFHLPCKLSIIHEQSAEVYIYQS